MDKNENRGVRFVIIGLALFFIIFVIIKVLFDESKNLSSILTNIKSSQTILFVLWTIIILFSITFLFIFVRNLIKLYYDKNKERTGSRFKKRLVFFFITFSIVPTVFLFIFTTELIDRGVEKWFQTDIDSIMTKSKELKESYYEKSKDDLKYFSRIVSNGIKSKKMYTDDNAVFLRNWVKRQMKNYRLDVVNIFRNSKEIVSQFNPVIPLQEYKDLSLEDVYKVLSGSDFIKVDSLERGELIRSGIPFNSVDNDKILVIIGKYYPENYIKNLKNINTMVDRYLQMKLIRDPVKTTYYLLFVFISILIVFSASWVALYLARGITTPIEKLVDAASEITKGNLDVNINYIAKDEFNILINEFNKMIYDLKENRDKLSRRTIELRQRRSITENILKNITSGVIAINSRGEIIEINPAVERMLGLKKEKVIKRQFSDIFNVSQYEDIKNVIKKAFESKFKLFEKEVNIKIKGKILNLAIKITQTRNPVNNKFSGILVVMTDLTALMKAQRMLVWREVAKRIAHEIKNPLTPIQISSQRILRSIDLSDEKFRKIVEDGLNIILTEIDSIKKLADEFSGFARLPEIKFSKGDINQILEKLNSVYTSIYNQVEFKVDLDPEIPILIKMDTEQIKRIFVNILDNGIEAIDKKGKIEIVSKYNKESQFVRIEIADNGEGINDEDKEKLFLPYFSKKSTGTGLGLAISHSIIEEHNGMISIVDNTPKGSRFIVELPS
ncbi:MAG: ATP-binding protein [Acidobacteriota bacterium]